MVRQVAVFEVPRVGPEEEAALRKIDVVRRDLRFYSAEPRRWVGQVRRILAALAIQGSNSIEGYHVSVEDALAAIQGDEPAEAGDEDWHAVVGYRRAMTYVLQLAQDRHFEYTAGLLRSLHFMMTESSLDAGPGLWRPKAIWIRNQATGEIVYEGPEADEVPDLIEALVEQLAVQDAPALVRAAMAHLNLVMIHPFRDGNGRMARGLQTLVLAREGILAPEFSSIEEYLGANTGPYYRVLEDVGQGRWNPQNNARPWVRFCLRAHYIQAMSVLRRVRESERIWAELETLASQNKLPERAIVALFDAALGLRVRNSTYRATLKLSGEDISNQVATLDLRSMVKAGLLAQQGKARGSSYVAGEAVAEIRRRIRTGRQPIDTSTLFAPDGPEQTAYGPRRAAGTTATPSRRR